MSVSADRAVLGVIKITRAKTRAARGILIPR
jgi:hypothetical protein